MAGFWLLVVLHREGSAINGATPSSFYSLLLSDEIVGEPVPLGKHCHTANLHSLLPDLVHPSKTVPELLGYTLRSRLQGWKVARLQVYNIAWLWGCSVYLAQFAVLTDTMGQGVRGRCWEQVPSNFAQLEAATLLGINHLCQYCNYVEASKGLAS